jgi:hypothetical protein
MSHSLSPQAEQFLASIVVGGLYPSKEAALEAAVAALREKSALLSPVPDEHVVLVEEAIIAADQGELRSFDKADWLRLRQFAHEVAARNSSDGE